MTGLKRKRKRKRNKKKGWGGVSGREGNGAVDVHFSLLCVM